MMYFAMNIVIIVLVLAILTVIMLKNNEIKTTAKKWFLTCLVLIATGALLEFFTLAFTDPVPGTVFMHKLFTALGFSIYPAVPICCGISIYKVKNKWLCFIPIAVHFVLEVFSIFYGFIFTVDTNNVFAEQSFFWIYILMLAISIGFFILQTCRFINKYRIPDFISISLIVIFLIAGLVVQIVFSDLKTEWLTLTIGFVLYYIYYTELFQQIDPLTLLLNRKCYENRLKNQHKEAIVLIVDIDSFKDVNDHFGHQYGDACLRDLGAILLSVYGDNGTCFRIGGDEFCIIIDRTIEDIHVINQNFKDTIVEHRRKDQRMPTVSYGYFKFNPKDMGYSEALDRADEEMYNIKKDKIKGK